MFIPVLIAAILWQVETPKLVFPWVTSTAPFTSRLCLVNLNQQSQTLMLEARDSAGAKIRKEHVLAANAQLVDDASRLFPELVGLGGFSVFCYVEQGELQGALVIASNGSPSGFSPAQANAMEMDEASHSIVFPFQSGSVESSTAIVLVNLDDEVVAQVVLTAFENDEVVGHADVTVQAGANIAHMLSDLLPEMTATGYVLALSDTPIMGTSFTFNRWVEPAMSHAIPTTAISETNEPNTLLDLFVEHTEAYLDGEMLVIRTDDIPNHASPYFATNDASYEAPHEGMQLNPNRIYAQDFEFRVPLNPKISGTLEETRLGPIGVATNGVVFFNQYAGRTATGWVPLDQEIETFDRFNGHPQQQGAYHYHLEPTYLTESDPSTLIGVMLDGFPIYGPYDADLSVPSDLDACNGHEHVTAEFPNGIYHYHATPEPPYLIGCFKGTAGTLN